MRNKIKKILITLFFICIIATNTFAAPIHYYPNKYNITINNITKRNIEKIEIFTPWGFFDEEDKVEIDGRLFNYSGIYSNGIKGEEYRGVKCKILDVINKKDIKEISNGINFSISGVETIFHLKIYTKDGNNLFTDGISSSMIIDEFSCSDKEYVAKVENFQKETISFIGNYTSNDTWILMKEENETIQITEDIYNRFSFKDIFFRNILLMTILILL